MSFRGLAGAVALTAMGCSAAPSHAPAERAVEPATRATGGSVPPLASSAVADAGAALGDAGSNVSATAATPSADAGAVPGAPAPGAAQACPADMVLVDADYCTELEVRCLEQWHAPQNHLWVCEKVAEPTRCTGPTRHVRFCIDRYEFPNRAGVRPMVMQNFYQAEVHCAKRGKRLCTESEWTKACEGPDNRPFPYGYVRDPAKCRGDRPWDFPVKDKLLARDPAEIERLWQGVPSGSQPNCASGYGVHDMPGNADELAASEHAGRAGKDDFDNVTTGGPWYKGVRNMCRPKIYTHDESFAYYYLSWRCCQEPDGKPTEPRAPKQLKRGTSWERVLYLAEHSWLLPFNPKVPGDPGYSAAGPDRP
jgi:formylglycine-generating enzyme